MLSVPLKVPNTNTTLFSSYAAPFNVQGKSLAEMPASSLTVLLVENQQGDILGDVYWLVGQLGKRNFLPDAGVVL